jgi:hypothetical protein
MERSERFIHHLIGHRFQVEEGLSNDLRVGLFSRVNNYDAVVRFSANGGTEDAFTNNLNGFAVKVCGVEQNLGSSYLMWDQRAMRDEKERGITGARYNDKTVDIDFINDSAGSTFFAKNTREVLWVMLHYFYLIVAIINL